MSALIHIGVSEEPELKFSCSFLKASNLRKVKAATKIFFQIYFSLKVKAKISSAGIVTKNHKRVLNAACTNLDCWLNSIP